MPALNPDELRAEYARLAATVRHSRTALAQAEAVAVTALTSAGLNRAAIAETLGLTSSTQRDRVREWPAEASGPARTIPDAIGEVELATARLDAARQARGAFIVDLHENSDLSLRQVAAQLEMGDAYLGRLYRLAAARLSTPRPAGGLTATPAATIRAWASRQGLRVAARAGIANAVRTAYTAHQAGNRQPLDHLLEDQAIRVWAAEEGLSFGTNRGIPRKTRAAYRLQHATEA